MFEGQKFKINEMEYVVPALSLGALRKFSQEGVLAKLGSLTGAPSADQVEVALVLIQAAWCRNYPGTSIEQLAEMIDMGNFAPILKSIFGQSGIEEVKPGEAPSP